MEQLARRCGFRPWGELTTEEQQRVTEFVKRQWPLLELDTSIYYWKESTQSPDTDWICFNVNSLEVDGGIQDTACYK